MIRKFAGFPELFERMWQAVVDTRRGDVEPQRFLAGWLDHAVRTLGLVS
jgi:hypothetical protein